MNETIDEVGKEPIASLHDLSKDGREMQQIHEIYVEVGMNKKYFAKMLSTCQKTNRWWDTILVGLSVSILVIASNSPSLNKESEALYLIAALSAFSIVGSVCKPYFLPSSTIDRYARLCQEYASLYSQMRDIEDELWITEQITPTMRKELTRCRQRITNISVEEDLVPNRNDLERFQQEVQEELGMDQNRLYMPRGGDDGKDETTATNETRET